MAGQDIERDRLMSSNDSDHEKEPRSSSSSDLSTGIEPPRRRRNASPSRRIFGLRTSVKHIRILIGLAVVAVLGLTVYLFWNRRGPQPLPYHAPTSGSGKGPGASGKEPGASGKGPGASGNATSTWVKPHGFKIIGFVFYGRPRYVNILDCYLKKNLVTRGGYLDEIHFMLNTQEQMDREWLDELIKTEPLYKKFDTGESGGHYNSIWDHAKDPDTMYIKIDDDVVYVHDDAIPRMVHTLMDHPEALDVAANIVNSPLTHWLHYHTDAILPYMPDPEPPAKDQKPTWRPSELPQYPGDVPDKFEFTDIPDGGFNIGDKGGPPFKNHRWLPLENTPANLAKTPIAAGADYNPWGMAWFRWTISAQQQYSLFNHIEKNDFGAYYAGNSKGVWNMQYTRYNLNFLAIWGRNVALRPIGADDEDALTVAIPKDVKMPCLVDTHAIVGHFSFAPTPELGNTDLLDRYLAYANEMVCEKDNYRPTLDPKFLKTHD